MFKKLISNLPFNPSLLEQVSFYTKRLKQEQSIRRLGFVFMALAMFIQVFAVAAPPQKSLAYSNDYIINGLKTREDILRAWDGQTADVKVAEIYSKFGITRADIANLTPSPNVTIASNQADFWTIGRTSLSAVSKAGQIKSQYKNSETPINTGSTTVYARQLRAWDIVNPVNYYKAWQGTKNGKTFYILKDCGNFTTIGPPPTVVPPTTPPPTPTTPTPPPTPTLSNPGLEFRKTIDGGARALKPGDQFSFRFEYRNPVPNSRPAENVVITDTLDRDNFTIVSSTANFLFLKNDNVATLALGTVPYSPDYKTAAVLTVKLKKDLTNGLNVCNAATLSASNASSVTSGGSNLCVSVLNPCPLDGSVPSATDPRCTTPVLVCSVTQSSINRTTKESTLTTRVTTSNPTLTRVTSYAYNFGDNSTKTNNSSALTDTVRHTYKDGTYSARVTVNYYIGSDSRNSKNVACASEVTTEPDKPLSPAKFASNITQRLTNEATLTTKAHAKDVIEYALNVHNSYDYERTSYTITDYIGDVLDYTTLDTAFLREQGGTYDEATKTVTWANQTVPASSTLQKKFRVTVKDPVPSTNQPGVLSTAFDCVISNKYGSETSIPIDCPVVKSAEYFATTLPNTGPGTSIAIGSLLTIFVGYFFARSRLLGKELELIRVEYATGGGF